jgi:hypothetical protein
MARGRPSFPTAPRSTHLARFAAITQPGSVRDMAARAIADDQGNG